MYGQLAKTTSIIFDKAMVGHHVLESSLIHIVSREQVVKLLKQLSRDISQFEKHLKWQCVVHNISMASC